MEFFRLEGGVAERECLCQCLQGWVVDTPIDLTWISNDKVELL